MSGLRIRPAAILDEFRGGNGHLSKRKQDEMAYSKPNRDIYTL